MLDDQSGITQSGGGKSSGKTFHGQPYVKDHNVRPLDKGGASRFFLCVKYDKSTPCGNENIKIEDMCAGKKTVNKRTNF